MEDNIENLKYPIGKFKMPADVTPSEIADAIQTISIFPTRLAEAILGLDTNQLETLYRPGGWTIRQVVHHCADSHINAYVRFKLALTEDQPTIKPYEEAKWAELADSNMEPDISLKIIEGVHARWVHLLKSLPESDWNKTFVHPEHQKTFSLKQVLVNYEWHCNHHLAHVIKAKSPSPT